MPTGFTTRCWKSAESPPRRLPGLVAATLLALLAAAGCAVDSSPPPASLEVAAIDLIQGQDSARLQASLEHRLSGPVLDALRNGVSLTFVWELELIAERDWLWDAEVWSTRGARQLSYRSLSRRYTVSAGGAHTATSFPDVDQAVAALSRLERVVPLPRALLDDLTRPRLRFRTRLDIAALPPPLRLPSYLSPAWRLDSGWYGFSPD